MDSIDLWFFVVDRYLLPRPINCDLKYLPEIIVQEWLFIVFRHCHQIFHIFFYQKSVKNAKIGDFWEYPGPNLATLWKSGNVGILAISAALPDDSNSKSPKIGQKCQNKQFMGKIQIQIWWRFKIWIIKQFFMSKWSTIVTAALTVWPDDLKWKLPNIM